MTRSLLLCVPTALEYPHAALLAGAKRLGFKVDVGAADADILLTWSPWKGSRREALVNRFKAAGRSVIVAENGFLSPIASERYTQLALGGWNGTGRYPKGGEERWRSWRVPVAPWRRSLNGHVLVIGQRGHPFDARTALPGWHERVQIDSMGLPVRRRPRDSQTPLADDLAGAVSCHVWTSNVAVHAVLAGVPIVQYGPNLMVSALASRPGNMLAYPDYREELFGALAWAQWSERELETGEPLARLLSEKI